MFKWTPTTYPELDEIHVLLDPYQKLFSTILKWQKAEKKFMDGAFQDLGAETTQAEVLYSQNQHTCDLINHDRWRNLVEIFTSW